MANKGGSKKGKNVKISSREKILIGIVAVLLIVLVVTLIVGNGLGSIINGAGDDTELNATKAELDKAKSDLAAAQAQLNKFVNGSSQKTPELEGDILEVHFIDIGQGDAIVAMLPDGKILLIDAGSGTSVSNATKAKYNTYLERTLAVDEIDYMIITHPDSDHVNMAQDVLKNYDVHNIYFNEYDTEKTSKTYTNFKDAAKSETTSTGKAVCNEIKADSKTFNIDGGSYKLDIYAVGDTNVKGDSSFANAISIICILEYGGRKVMFTGDAEAATERWFMSELGENGVDIDVLKVGHHGSRTCTTKEFIDYVKPEYAVISCGENNSYSHPHPETMTTLFDYGAVTYRTDRHGDIVLYIDEDGDFGFLPEKNVQVENNTKNRDVFTILKDMLAA